MVLSEADRKEFWACLALKYSSGIGLVTIKRLMDQYEGAYGAVTAVARWQRDGLATDKQVRSFRSELWREKGREEWDGLAALGCDLLLAIHDDYPPMLRQIPDPPPYLYVEGDRSLALAPCVALVGSRKTTEYGRFAAEAIARDLSAAGICVVSGLAYGIDRQAHLGGLSGPGSSIAVLGCGLDVEYPQDNLDIRHELAASGLVMTEFAPGEKPRPQSFPRRNRLISGLCLGVVVVEGGAKSGSLITARLAMEQGRDVFAVGGPVGATSFTGGNSLINEGAKLIASGEDVLVELGPLLKAGHEPGAGAGREGTASGAPRMGKAGGPKPDVDEGMRVAKELGRDEAAIYDHLSGTGPAHIDELCRELEVPSERISRALTMLELGGLVRRLPGMRFEKSGGRP